VTLMSAYVLQRLNRIIDRLFGFDLQPEERHYLAETRKLAESRDVLDVRATLTGLR